MFDNEPITALRLTVASPTQIRAWSSGEVTLPETINYLTDKPEPDGLYCERIFGPIADWTCACGGRTLASGGRVLVQRPVRPMGVVMVGVLAEDQLQVPFAGDQHPVQALAAGTGDPAFGYSIRARRLEESSRSARRSR